jgi:acetylornithine deacetylase
MITFHEGSDIPRSSEICSVVGSAVTALTGKTADFGAATYGSDMRILVSYDRIPTLLFGPGDIAQAHAVDEYLCLEDYFRATEIYALIALRWCGIAS